jgi:hypothetical protein
MPVFDDVDKVIVVPGESGGDGCGGCIGNIIGLFVLVGIIAIATRACEKDKAQVSTRTPSVQSQTHSPRPVPQRRQVSVQRFVPLGVRRYPEVRPPLIAYWPEFSVVRWQGRNVRIRHKPNIPYAYLCVVNGWLTWCWPRPPNQMARPCTNIGGQQGWCWQESEWR